MPVVAEVEQSEQSVAIDAKNEEIVVASPPHQTVENSKIGLPPKFTTQHFPQPNAAIEPLYPVEASSPASHTATKKAKTPNEIEAKSGDSSPLEIVGQTTGQLTKTNNIYSASLPYSSLNSFQIINPDTLGVVSRKPNAIVRPVRRSEIISGLGVGLSSNAADNGFGYGKKGRNGAVSINTDALDGKKRFGRSIYNIDGATIERSRIELSSQIPMRNKQLKFDKVNGSTDFKSVDGMPIIAVDNANGSRDAGTVATSANVLRKPGFFSEMTNFAKELNQKLSRLRGDKTSPTRSTSKNSTLHPQYNDPQLIKRPLFITTVPSGVFLPPAKEVSPTAQKRVYAFSSRPRIFTIYRSTANYPAAAGYYTTANNYQSKMGSSDIENKSPGDTVDGSSGDIRTDSDGLEKAKQSLHERTKRDVFRGSSNELKPYNFYRNNGMQSSISPSFGSNRTLDRKDPPKREPAPPQPFKNLMHDKRVVRGSNYSQPQGQQWNPYFANAGLLSGKDQQIYVKEQEAKRRSMLRKRCLARNQRNVIGSPPAVHGRVHIPIQTEKYLEELFDRPPEFDANTQTDLFLQRPPSPPYIAAKVGVDRATQIEKGELFDFDAEAQPIVDTFVQHSVQQSLMETMHEQEIAELKAKQEEYLARREAELAELRRLEEEERRLQEEKERRLKQDALTKQLDIVLQEEVTAAKLLQGHIATILPDVLQQLEPQIDFASQADLENKICPWLSKEVAEEVGKIIDSREILTEIIKEIIIQRASVYAGLLESETETEEAKSNAEQEEDEVPSEDDDFIRMQIDRMIEKVEDKSEIDEEDGVTTLETIEEEFYKEDAAVQQLKVVKRVQNLEELIEATAPESSEIEDGTVEVEVEKLVQEEVMNIILQADLAESAQTVEVKSSEDNATEHKVEEDEVKVEDRTSEDKETISTEDVVKEVQQEVKEEVKEEISQLKIETVKVEPVMKEVATEDVAEKKAVAEEAAKDEAVTEEAVKEEAVIEEAATEEAVIEDAVKEAVTEEEVKEEAVTEEAATEKAVTEEATTEEAVIEDAAKGEEALDENNESNYEGIVRDEVERILSLAESVDDSADLITQIEVNAQQQSLIDNDATDVDDDSDNDDDDNELSVTDEQYLRNQIEQMITDAEESAKSPEKFSYIS